MDLDRRRTAGVIKAIAVVEECVYSVGIDPYHNLTRLVMLSVAVHPSFNRHHCRSESTGQLTHAFRVLFKPSNFRFLFEPVGRGELSFPEGAVQII